MYLITLQCIRKGGNIIMKKISKAFGNCAILFVGTVVASYWSSFWFVGNEEMPKSLKKKR